MDQQASLVVVGQDVLISGEVKLCTCTTFDMSADELISSAFTS
jgi:hypothetical protein